MKKQNLTPKTLTTIRIEGLNQLNEFYQTILKLVEGSKYAHFWDQLKLTVDRLPTRPKRQRYLWVYSQIVSMPLYLESWLNDCLKDDQAMDKYLEAEFPGLERAEKLIKVEAVIMALELVMSRGIFHVKRWVKMTPDEVIEDPVFHGLGKLSIEDQFRLETKRIKEVKPFYT